MFTTFLHAVKRGDWTHLLFSTPNSNFQLFILPWWYGFLNACMRTEEKLHFILNIFSINSVFQAFWLSPQRTNVLYTSTFPFSLSLLVSLRLMCRSTLVSPLLMSMMCHRVSPPRATATELHGGQITTWPVCMLSTFIWCLNTGNQCAWCGVRYLVSTQRKRILLWLVVSLKSSGGEGVW